MVTCAYSVWCGRCGYGVCAGLVWCCVEDGPLVVGSLECSVSVVFGPCECCGDTCERFGAVVGVGVCESVLSVVDVDAESDAGVCSDVHGAHCGFDAVDSGNAYAGGGVDGDGFAGVFVFGGSEFEDVCRFECEVAYGDGLWFVRVFWVLVYDFDIDPLAPCIGGCFAPSVLESFDVVIGGFVPR